MAWPVWIGAALAVMAFSVWRGADYRPALLILTGLFIARIITAFPFEAHMAASALLWCGIGAILVRRSIAPIAGGLLIASGLCYLGARLAYSPVAVGSVPFVLSDVFGALALCSVAWSARNGLGGDSSARSRGWVLGWAADRRGRSARDNLDRNQEGAGP